MAPARWLQEPDFDYISSPRDRDRQPREPRVLRERLAHGEEGGEDDAAAVALTAEEEAALDAAEEAARREKFGPTPRETWAQTKYEAAP